MAKLTTKARKDLPKKDFVEPGKEGYPIEDRSHARNALSRSSGKPVHAAVVKKVEKKFPNLAVNGKPPKMPKMKSQSTSTGYMVGGPTATDDNAAIQ